MFYSFLSNEIQNVTGTGLETDLGMARKSSNSCGLNSNPKLLSGITKDQHM